eukprot:6207517-Pleurochrysis_carterae.AAC.6
MRAAVRAHGRVCLAGRVHGGRRPSSRGSDERAIPGQELGVRACDVLLRCKGKTSSGVKLRSDREGHVANGKRMGRGDAAGGKGRRGWRDWRCLDARKLVIMYLQAGSWQGGANRRGVVCSCRWNAHSRLLVRDVAPEVPASMRSCLRRLRSTRSRATSTLSSSWPRVAAPRTRRTFTRHAGPSESRGVSARAERALRLRRDQWQFRV